jgi:hypothetical protein
MKKAPKGVGWGTTNTPKSKRIDPKKTYMTESGLEVVHLHIKLDNGNGREATFPVKGSIKKSNRKNARTKFCIWTLDGKEGLFGPSENDLREAR